MTFKGEIFYTTFKGEILNSFEILNSLYFPTDRMTVIWHPSTVCLGVIFSVPQKNPCMILKGCNFVVYWNKISQNSVWGLVAHVQGFGVLAEARK